MDLLFPEIEPYDTGLLDVGDGQRMYFELCGNPTGKPALVLHGGPGSGCTPFMRRLFNPDVYRVVLFDQRGAGRSTPRASDPSTRLAENTTHHLLRDIERLRAHLAIRRWLLFGVSWGSTLGLTYAQRWPERVSEMVLASVTTTRPSEIHWQYHEAGRYLPEAWQRFRSTAKATTDGDLVAAYHRRIHGDDPNDREAAVRAWCDWEAACVSVDPKTPPNPRYADAAFCMGFARLVTHYFHNRAWLEDGVLLRDAPSLSAIPGFLIHGRLDLGAPIATAWELAQRWPGSELVVVEDAGHDSRARAMRQAIVHALNRCAVR